jgi:dihydrofolate reductase
MKKLVLFLHTSLDGFVAGPNGEMDWINVDDAIFDYAGNETDKADTALYGRVTWQMMDAYWPTAADQPNASKHDIQHGNWYNDVQKYVLSNSMKDNKAEKTTFISGDIITQIKKLKQQDGKNLVMFGSPSVAHLLIKNNLVDEYWLFVNPVLLGAGIPLFKDGSTNVKLKLNETKSFDSGVVALQYLMTNAD